MSEKKSEMHNTVKLSNPWGMHYVISLGDSNQKVHFFLPMPKRGLLAHKGSFEG